MKTINLQQFHDSVLKLAAKKKRAYSTVNVCLGEHTYGDGTKRQTIEFKCYVDGYGFHEGKTPSEAILKLKYAMFPAQQPIPTVEVSLL